MFEHKSEPLISKPEFYARVLRNSLLGMGIIFVSLLIGICGYHYIEGFPWVDALLDASMILGGMGPVRVLHTTAGKLFASFYALYSGIAFLGVAGVVLAPIYHRFLHRFHLEVEAEDFETGKKD